MCAENSDGVKSLILRKEDVTKRINCWNFSEGEGLSSIKRILYLNCFKNIQLSLALKNNKKFYHTLRHAARLIFIKLTLLHSNYTIVI